MSDNRPLSPHLTIHKKILTSILSISHRFSGIGLSIGSILISFWISLLALGPKYFYLYQLISSNIIFKIILFFWTLGIFYHLFNGIRYLYWSLGWGFELRTVYLSGYIVICLTFISTLAVWLIK